MLSEVLSALFFRHQEFLLNNLRWRRAFGLKSELEVVDDFVNDRMIFYKSDDLKESFLRDRIARIMYLPTRSASSLLPALTLVCTLNPV